MINIRMSKICVKSNCRPLELICDECLSNECFPIRIKQRECSSHSPKE